jgi:ribulose-5-phosphate 4-epimerase/fuculose-1-phosphate aldolase
VGHDIVLMRGHGSTVVGGSIRQVVYRAVYAELNARYQLQAMQLGDDVIFLSEGESRACVQNIEAQVQRPWDLWVEQARAKRSTPMR